MARQEIRLCSVVLQPFKTHATASPNCKGYFLPIKAFFLPHYTKKEAFPFVHANNTHECITLMIYLCRSSRSIYSQILSIKHKNVRYHIRFLLQSAQWFLNEAHKNPTKQPWAGFQDIVSEWIFIRVIYLALLFCCSEWRM